jgi:hypothetical protein
LALISFFSLDRENLLEIKPKLNYDSLPLLIFVNKGIEVGTQALTLEIIAETLGKDVARSATFLVSSTLPLSTTGSHSFSVVWSILCKRK